MDRLFIYPADICKLTGKSPNTGRSIYNKILKDLDKTKEQGLTIEDYCTYTKAPEDKVMRCLNSK
jgi:hypothetical protein